MWQCVSFEKLIDTQMDGFVIFLLFLWALKQPIQVLLISAIGLSQGQGLGSRHITLTYRERMQVAFPCRWSLDFPAAGPVLHGLKNTSALAQPSLFVWTEPEPGFYEWPCKAPMFVCGAGGGRAELSSGSRGLIPSPSSGVKEGTEECPGHYPALVLQSYDLSKGQLILYPQEMHIALSMKHFCLSLK